MSTISAQALLQNLKHLKAEPKFKFLEHDICVPFDPKRVDYVFNFASPASPADYMRLGIETLMVGSAGTKIYWRSPGPMAQNFCMRQRRSATAIPYSILRPKNIGAM